MVADDLGAIIPVFVDPGDHSIFLSIAFWFAVWCYRETRVKKVFHYPSIVFSSGFVDFSFNVDKSSKYLKKEIDNSHGIGAMHLFKYILFYNKNTEKKILKMDKK